jgi:hypothetical protein
VATKRARTKLASVTVRAAGSGESRSAAGGVQAESPAEAHRTELSDEGATVDSTDVVKAVTELAKAYEQARKDGVWFAGPLATILQRVRSALGASGKIGMGKNACAVFVHELLLRAVLTHRTTYVISPVAFVADEMLPLDEAVRSRVEELRSYMPELCERLTDPKVAKTLLHAAAECAQGNSEMDRAHLVGVVLAMIKPSWAEWAENPGNIRTAIRRAGKHM